MLMSRGSEALDSAPSEQALGRIAFPSPSVFGLTPKPNVHLGSSLETPGDGLFRSAPVAFLLHAPPIPIPIEDHRV